MISSWQDAGWPVVRLEQIASFCSGGTPSRRRSDFFSGDIPWLTGQDIPEGVVSDVSTGRDYITAEAVRDSATRIVPENTVLLTTRVSVGKTAVVARPLCFSQDVTGIILGSPQIALPHFVAYFLLSQRQRLLQLNQGSTIAGITRSSLALGQIPLPTLSEQKQIIEILQQAKEIRRLGASLEMKAAELLPTIFRKMFLQSRSRAEWREVTVAQIAIKSENSIRTGPFGSDLLHSEFVDHGVPVLGIDNVVQNRFRWHERRFITPLKYMGLRRFRVYPDDVMVTIMGTVGRVAIAPPDLPESISTKHLCVVTVDQSLILPIFLWVTLLYDPFVRAQAKTVGTGAIMEGWNSKIIRSLRFRLPPLDLQREFVALAQETLAMEESLLTSQNTTNEITASLLAHAFTGELTAEWRERNKSKLKQEAAARDEDLKASGAAPFRTAMIQEIEAIFARRTDGAFAELTREQWGLYDAIQRIYGGVVHARWFTAEGVAGNPLAGPLRGNRQAVEDHLTVLSARGLIIPVSRQEELGSTGEIVYGTAYRLRLRDFEPEEGDAREPMEGDDARLREMARLVGRLEKERML